MLALDKLDFSGFRNKKGLSNLIAYVLLITISISLSMMVYTWLRFYVGGVEVATCPSNVNVIIDSYECDAASGILNVTIKNKGLFDVDGYVLRVHDREDAEFGTYPLDPTGNFLSPGGKDTTVYNFVNLLSISDVTLADVQPFVVIDDKNISCESYSSQKIKCN